jgi:hypothetical protein
VEQFELDGGPYFEEGKMKLREYFNNSAYPSIMKSSDGGSSILKGGPFTKPFE